jgi:hypothetical protein
MKLIARGTAGLLIVAGAALAPISVAEADTPGCVTLKEFRSIEPGMHVGKVARRFDTKGEPGRITAGAVIATTRKYQKCSDDGSKVKVDYFKGHHTGYGAFQVLHTYWN